MTTVGGALGWAAGVLAGAGIENGTNDARRIMAATLGVGPERVTLLMYDDLDPVVEAAFRIAVQKRAEGHPVSHLVGGRIFYDRWFTVTPDVLDPRPETETLIEMALKLQFRDVLDLGTGSGAIVVTLLAERLDAVGFATDISGAALGIAQRNAAAHDVGERFQCKQSDWFAKVVGQYDLIVSNPPYIAADEMAGLQREVLQFEPRIALTDEADGLTAYRIIAAQAPVHLRAGGSLLVEIGPTQGAAVAAFMRNAGLVDVAVIPDLDGRDRVVMGKLGPIGDNRGA